MCSRTPDPRCMTIPPSQLRQQLAERATDPWRWSNKLYYIIRHSGQQPNPGRSAGVLNETDGNRENSPLYDRRRAPLDGVGWCSAYERVHVSHRLPLDVSCLMRYHSPNSDAISDPTMRSIAERFLGVGESVFDVLQATVINSSYFKRDSKRE